MARIVLATLNARYSHTSLGLRYLQANLREWQAESLLQEFTLQQRSEDIVEQILHHTPEIVALGIYIWNVATTTAVVALIKRVAPTVTIIIGGPEVSHEPEQQEIVALADHVITGQADLAFYQLCTTLFNGQSAPHIIHAALPPLDTITLPYHLYSDEDIAQRVIYVEASRGCPFKCAFCLSALDRTAWPFPADALIAALDTLWQRGARSFKFVDRTFNLNWRDCQHLLDLFLQRLDSQTTLHFELIPDHLPPPLKERIARFPAGVLQFEVGIQSLNPEVQATIQRRQNNQLALENLRWLLQLGTIHLHTDLIIGLPGESWSSIANGFDQLIASGVQEIQVGILKRLRGAPVNRLNEPFSLTWHPLPPYQIISNNLLTFQQLQRLGRFARYWDLIGNSGRFRATRPLLLGSAPFVRMMALSDAIFASSQQTHKIAFDRLVALIHTLGEEVLTLDRHQLSAALQSDWQRAGQRGPLPTLTAKSSHNHRPTSARERQRRHQPRPAGDEESENAI
jgi:hypothetical protein